MNELSDKLAQRAGTAAPAKTSKPSSISDLIKVMEPEIKKALPSVMTPERFTRIAETPKMDGRQQERDLQAFVLHFEEDVKNGIARRSRRCLSLRT